MLRLYDGIPQSVRHKGRDAAKVTIVIDVELQMDPANEGFPNLSPTSLSVTLKTHAGEVAERPNAAVC